MQFSVHEKENERLYNQVKDLQEQNKKNEERMFKENQSLFSELASLKWVLSEFLKSNILRLFLSILLLC